MRLNGWLPSFYQVETVTKAVQQKGMVIKMKILFAASRMGIGGAETHIAGLASELTRRGHKIWIASAGGVLSEFLGEGIEHIVLPLDGKTPLAAAEALCGLAKLIKRENFDVGSCTCQNTGFPLRYIAAFSAFSSGDDRAP